MPAIGLNGPLSPLIPPSKAPAKATPVKSAYAAIGAAKARAMSPIPSHQATVTRASQTGMPAPSHQGPVSPAKQKLVSTLATQSQITPTSERGIREQLIAKLTAERPGVNYRFADPRPGAPNGLLVPHISGEAPDIGHPALPSTPLISPIPLPPVPPSIGIAPGGGLVRLNPGGPDRLPPHIGFGTKGHIKFEEPIGNARVGEWKPRPMQIMHPVIKPRLGQWDKHPGTLKLV